MVTSIFKKVFIMFLIGTFVLNIEVKAQELAKDEIQLVVSGDGTNKEEATKVALRGAIEQAFGTFVSSNTQMLNDEIVKDEIATVSSGNIKSFEYISENIIDEKSVVTLKAVVSIGKLVEYTKSKGAATELSGATFAMNMKIRTLNKQNELIAFHNLNDELNSMLSYAFDYEIKVDEPKEVGNRYVCNASITIKANNATKQLSGVFHETLRSLSLSDMEAQSYLKSGLTLSPLVISTREIHKSNTIERYIYTMHSRDLLYSQEMKDLYNLDSVYFLRNSYEEIKRFMDSLHTNIFTGALSFLITDNIGKYSFYRVDEDARDRYRDIINFRASNKERLKYVDKTNSEEKVVATYRITNSNGLRVWTEKGYDSPVLSSKIQSGETLYKIHITLNYTLDELEKISEIRIEPLVNAETK